MGAATAAIHIALILCSNKGRSARAADVASANWPDLILDIASSHYSNLAYVQVTHRDVYIDFLEMRGLKGMAGWR